MYKSLPLILSVVSSALTAPVDTVEKRAVFRLGMEVEGTLVTLTAVKNGTDGDIVLQAGKVSTTPGTTGKYLLASDFYDIITESMEH